MNKTSYNGYEIIHYFDSKTISVGIHGIEIKKFRKIGNIIGFFMAQNYINTLPIIIK